MLCNIQGFCINLNGQQRFTLVLKRFTLQQRANTNMLYAKAAHGSSHMEFRFIPNQKMIYC